VQDFITAKRDEIVELCRIHHVRRFSIFGSAVRDDFDPSTSDVDVRVEFSDEALDNYVQNLHSLHDRLQELLGRKVDILSAKEIRNPFLRRSIESSQVTLYAA
jgi:hypothetical protein